MKLLAYLLVLVALPLFAAPAEGTTSTNEPTAAAKPETIAYLGIFAHPVTTPTLRKQLKLSKGTGLIVAAVARNSPAAAAGLKMNDILLKLDGQLLINKGQFRTLIQLKKPGDKITLDLLRKGKALTLKATMGDRKMIPRSPIKIPLPPEGLNLYKEYHLDSPRKKEGSDGVRLELDLNSLLEIYRDETLSEAEKQKKASELLDKQLFPNIRKAPAGRHSRSKDRDYQRRLRDALRKLPREMRERMDHQLRDSEGRYKKNIRILETKDGPLFILEEFEFTTPKPTPKKTPSPPETSDDADK